MVTAYLALNAVLYTLFAVWCSLAPQQTSAFLGLTRSNAAGESEFLAVYGGLQAGMAVFYTVALFTDEHRRAALIFSVAIYGGLVALRSIAALNLGFAELGNARYTFVLELVLLIAAAVLVLRGAR